METISTHKSNGLLIHLFKLPIYDSKICFLRYSNSDEYKEAVEFAKKIGVQDETLETDEYMLAYGFTDKHRTEYGFVHFVFLNNAKEYASVYQNTLAHENFHLVHNICKHHGIDFIDDNANEPYAYLTGYLFQYLSTL